MAGTGATRGSRGTLAPGCMEKIVTWNFSCGILWNGNASASGTAYRQVAQAYPQFTVCRDRRDVRAADGGLPVMSGFSRRLYALVRQIPQGQVATYGQLALLLGNPRMSRAVGTASAPAGTTPSPATGWSAVWAACQMPFAPFGRESHRLLLSWRPSPSPRRATWTCPGASGLDRHEGQSYIILTICPFLSNFDKDDCNQPIFGV